jgi:hypothetical protein
MIEGEIMASTDLREIIGDVRFALSNDLRNQYPERDGTHGFSHSAEAYLIKAMYGVDVKGRSADYYIAPGDGGGVIVVEVGDRNDAEWQDLDAKDGKPVRVLNVGLNGRVTLEHPRHTTFEEDLMSVLGRSMTARSKAKP